MVCTLLVYVAGCATPPPSTPPTHPATSSDDEALSANLLFQVMAAEVAAQRGESGAAYGTLLAAARESGDARLARRAVELAVTHRALPQALEAAQVWYALAPQLEDAAHTLGALLIANQQIEAAEPVYAPWVAKDPAKHLVQVQRAINNAQDRKAAFALLARLAEPVLQGPQDRAAQVHLILAAGAVAADWPDRATQEVLTAHTLQPDDEHIASAAAQYLAGADPTDKAAAAGRAQALALLEKFLSAHPQAHVARIRYARLLAADHQLDAAVQHMQVVLEGNPDNLEVLYALSMMSVGAPPHTKARAYTMRYLETLARQPSPPTSAEPRDPASAYLHLARLAEDERHYSEALNWAQKISAGPLFFTARLQEALLLGRLKRVDEGRKLLAGLRVGNDEEQMQITLTDAAVLRNAQRHREAYTVLTEALKRHPDEPNLLYDTAMAAERLNRLDAMETHLRRLIQLRPNHAHAHNALGYTWVDRNMRLDEAQPLIERAYALAPDDAAIIDSVGWLYYRRGKLSEAKEMLEQAYTLRPDADVGVHLGEVLWQRGERDAARTLWRQVRERDPDNETLRHTLQRLKIKL